MGAKKKVRKAVAVISAAIDQATRGMSRTEILLVLGGLAEDVAVRLGRTGKSEDEVLETLDRWLDAD